MQSEEVPVLNRQKIFLDFFAVPDKPPWRNQLSDQEQESTPTPAEMVKDIVRYRQIYENRRQHIEKEDHKKVIRKLVISFLMHVQREEDIGVQDRGKTEQLMDEVEQQNEEEPQSSLEVDLLERYDDSIDEATSEPEEGEEEDKKKKEKRKETQNLCRAYIRIKAEVDKAIEAEDDESIGYIDLECCVQGVHKIAMENLVHDPGEFSDLTRRTSFEGKRHYYPRFIRSEQAAVALETLIENYNFIVGDIRRKKYSDEEKMLLSFKCASLFLFAFLGLHPFSDGNGRVGRLLASYSLWNHNPFMTPIYNVFSSSCRDDYVRALVRAREGLELPKEVFFQDEAEAIGVKVLEGKPADLCAMLIESNWAMWRQCLHQLHLETIHFHEWEVDRSSGV